MNGGKEILEEKRNHHVVQLAVLLLYCGFVLSRGHTPLSAALLCAQSSRTHATERSQSVILSSTAVRALHFAHPSGHLILFQVGEKAAEQKEARALGSLKFRAVGPCNILKDPGHFD